MWVESGAVARSAESFGGFCSYVRATCNSPSGRPGSPDDVALRLRDPVACPVGSDAVKD